MSQTPPSSSRTSPDDPKETSTSPSSNSPSSLLADGPADLILTRSQTGRRSRRHLLWSLALSVALGALLSGLAFGAASLWGWGAGAGGDRNRHVACLLERDLERRIAAPTRELRASALRFGLWVTLPQEALERSLRLMSLRQPTLEELLVADAQGRILAAFSPEAPLGEEGDLVGSPDPHNKRRLALTQKRRGVYLFKRRGDHVESLLLAFPILGTPHLGDTVKHPTPSPSLSLKGGGDPGGGDPGGGAPPTLRGYVAATFPLSPIQERLKALAASPELKGLRVSTRSGLKLFPPQTIKKEHLKSVGSSRPRLQVAWKSSGPWALILWVILPGLLGALFFFLFASLWKRKAPKNV